MKKKVLSPNNEAGQQQTSDPRPIEEIVKDFLAHSNSPFAVAYRQHLAEQQQAQQQTQGMHQTTELCVDLKTRLMKDARAKVGKEYHGTLRRDVICEDFLYDDQHFTFTEETPAPARKANPQVYAGQYVTITRQKDGSYRPNLKPQTFNDHSRIVGYATQVGNELLWGLGGLVGEED